MIPRFVGAGKAHDDCEKIGEAREELYGADAVGMFEHHAKFLADAFAADGGDIFLKGGHGVGGFGGDGEFEAGGEADGAEHAEVVFGEAGFGVADGAEGFGVDVALAADEIVELACAGVGEGVEEEAVAGEIAAVGVFMGVGEADGGGVAAIGVGAVGTEGGDLDLVEMAV